MNTPENICPSRSWIVVPSPRVTNRLCSPRRAPSCAHARCALSAALRCLSARVHRREVRLRVEENRARPIWGRSGSNPSQMHVDTLSISRTAPSRIEETDQSLLLFCVHRAPHLPLVRLRRRKQCLRCERAGGPVLLCWGRRERRVRLGVPERCVLLLWDWRRR